MTPKEPQTTISIRIPTDLYTRLKAAATSEMRSINQQIMFAILHDVERVESTQEGNK